MAELLEWRFTDVKARLLDPTMRIDGGAVRPCARTLHRGGWNEDGFFIFGGESDRDFCDPECYVLRTSREGWCWKVVETDGDESMPAPERTSSASMAPWAERGTRADPGFRIGHQFTPFCNFMVLSFGMRDRGQLQGDIFVLNLDDGRWARPFIVSTVPSVEAVCADARPRPGATDQGCPTARTGHTCTPFSHGLVTVGGFDGKYQADVHHLRFKSGPGLLFTISEDNENAGAIIVKEIVPKSHASTGDIIRLGDALKSINGVDVEGMPLPEVQEALIGDLQTTVTLEWSRQRTHPSGKPLSFKTVLRRGDRLSMKDGFWEWAKTDVPVAELSHSSWYDNSGVSGLASQSAPSGRFNHSALAFGNNVLLFGGFDGTDYQNDLHILETFAEGDMHRQWKWRALSPGGSLPETRSHAGFALVDNRAVLVGGSRGSVRFADVHVLDCDRWVWSKVEVKGMLPITGHCLTPYPASNAEHTVTEVEVMGMTLDQLTLFLRDRGVDVSAVEERSELVTLAKFQLLRPGLLIFSGHQTPNEAGEKSGRRTNTFYLQVGSTPKANQANSPSPAAQPKSTSKTFQARWARDEERGRETDVFTTGSNLDGYLGLGMHRFAPMQPDPPPESISAYPNVCVRISRLSTNAFEWSLKTEQDQPRESDAALVGMACGAGHVLAVCKDGKMLAWGLNDKGQLGLGDDRQRQEACEVYAFPSGITTKVVAVACGMDHSLGITDADELISWGSNGHGQLGLGNTKGRNSPQRIDCLTGKGLRAICAGEGHSLALVDTGGLHAFGANHRGQLGIGGRMVARSPVVIAALKAKGVQHIHAGANHSVALCRNGSVWVWGDGGRGQLGTGAVEVKEIPVKLALGEAGAMQGVAVSCGNHFTGIIAREGQDGEKSLWMFGGNKDGELGLGFAHDSSLPMRVEGMDGKGVMQVACGFAHTLCVCEDGMVWGWGRNSAGQLGLGHNRDMFAPQQLLLEQGGRTEEDNYPWVASLPAAQRKVGLRTGNVNCFTFAMAGKDASFFLCSRNVLRRWKKAALTGLKAKLGK